MPVKKDEPRTDFGERLLEARKAAGLTQEQVQKKVGISQSALAEAEKKGTKSGLTPQLAALYGVNSEWLASGKGPREARIRWPFKLLTPAQWSETPQVLRDAAEKMLLPAGAHPVDTTSEGVVLNAVDKPAGDPGKPVTNDGETTPTIATQGVKPSLRVAHSNNDDRSAIRGETENVVRTKRAASKVSKRESPKTRKGRTGGRHKDQ